MEAVSGFRFDTWSSPGGDSRGFDITVRSESATVEPPDTLSPRGGTQNGGRDASGTQTKSFASRRKPLTINRLAICNMLPGRSGRKITELLRWWGDSPAPPLVASAAGPTIARASCHVVILVEGIGT